MSIKVSVVIPCYNHGEFLKEALQSALNSHFDDYEVIIVNDGSTDGSTISVFGDIEKNYQHYQRVRIIHQDNLGLAKARNNGISAAKGEYILTLDSDNMVRHDYLRKAVEVLDSNPQIGVVYAYARFFGDREGVWEMPVFNSRRLLLGNFIDACSVFRKVVWEQCNWFDPDMGIMGYEDWDFWISAVEKGWEFHLIKEVLFDYRVRNNSMIAACNIHENRRYLLKYVCNKHRNTYIENMPYVVSEKDIMRLQMENYAKDLEIHIKNHEAHIKNLEAIIKDKDVHIKNHEAIIKDKDALITNMQRTLGWRVLERLRIIRNKIFR